jgi:signal peptidase I
VPVDEPADPVPDDAAPDDAVLDGDDERAHDRATVRRAAVLVALFAVLFAVRTWITEPVRVRAESMAPTLHHGDVLVIDKLTYRFRDPHRGEIVITHDPRSGDSIVKRVVAVGGDSIGIEDGKLLRNGELIDEADANLDRMDGFYFGPIDVPQGHVFLLGDNRFESSDSRAFGPVPVDDIDGRYVARVWPL